MEEMKVRKIIFYTILTLLTILIPILLFALVNTMVSIKYETENFGDCISLVTDQDLCLTVNIIKGLILTDILIIISLIVFRKRILK